MISTTHALTEDERTRIQSAIKHFQALGIRAEIGGDIRYEVQETPGNYQIRYQVAPKEPQQYEPYRRKW
jgi:hypothetical protein